ncbi:unnamed protein product [Rotaria magnacalcarata]|uniref:Uncharacterized protein n=1 Tax=Rotaria magnacalcarata TaxID=392030 RepID=A0A819BBU2_9BILA|nr:unnamed protein product [Rotaria magnacalcarata]CAF2127476.1 unnamed protein product [Rotaria magnacalcarata]CAF3791717.1 unnamed protein product [Rotaria magnacalcarata]CAF4054103.1 unnamed protein product [Rotaria magnacalcarata]
MYQQNSKVSVTVTSAKSVSIQPRPFITQAFFLMWLDGNMDRTVDRYRNTLVYLQNIANDVYTFTQPDECIDFLTEVDDRKAFLILSDPIGKEILPLIHDIRNLQSIYIFGEHKAQHDDWNNSWNKIKGKYVEIVPIFEALKMSIKQINQNDISLSLINIKEEDSRQNLDQLEPSFMYTQIFKEVLFETDPTELNKEDFVQFWRNESKHNNITLEIIDEFDRDYCLQSTIWWYTRQSFIYEMLN